MYSKTSSTCTTNKKLVNTSYTKDDTTMMALFFIQTSAFSLQRITPSEKYICDVDTYYNLLAKLICNYCPLCPFLYLLFEESRINSVVVTKVGKVAPVFGSNYYVFLVVVWMERC